MIINFTLAGSMSIQDLFFPNTDDLKGPNFDGEQEKCTKLGNYEDVYDCFYEYRSDSAASLATATVALNNNNNVAAEKYAIKAAKATKFYHSVAGIIPGIDKPKTGGLAEMYILAHTANSRRGYDSTAKKYLETSGECYAKEDEALEKCVEEYFDFSYEKFKARNLDGARNDFPKLQLKGQITTEIDGKKKPLRHVKTYLKCAGEIYGTTTDDDGFYKLDLNSSMIPCLTAGLYVKLEYYNNKSMDSTDKITFMRVRHKGKSPIIRKVFEPRKIKDLTQNIHIEPDLNDPSIKGRPNAKDFYHLSTIYYHTTEALEFWKYVMKADIRYKLPVDVHTFQKNMDGAYYSPSKKGDIFLSYDVSLYNDTGRPMNREWHEFNHHVMYSEYKKWPRFTYDVPATHPQESENHKGFLNPSTDDSYVEGFAEFWSCVIADQYNYNNSNIYATFGNMDDALKPWFSRGFYEELSVTSILWDLYDNNSHSSNPDDDDVSMSIITLWDGIMSSYAHDFSEVYDDIINLADDEDDVNEIFKEHGFFKDKNAGNNRKNSYEGYLDYDDSDNYTVGDYYVDYGVPGARIVRNTMQYDEGEVIGEASNYQRSWRKSAVVDPDRNIKVDNDVAFYKVIVEYADYPNQNYEITVKNNNGFVALPILPDSYDATMTIEPIGVKYDSSLSMTAVELEEKYYESDSIGYMLEHDFVITSTIPIKSESVNIEADDAPSSEPYWEYEGVAKDSDYNFKEPRDTIRSDIIDMGDGDALTRIMGFAWLIKIVVIGLIVLAVYNKFFRKKKIKRTHHNPKKDSTKHDKHHEHKTHETDDD